MHVGSSHVLEINEATGRLLPTCNYVLGPGGSMDCNVVLRCPPTELSEPASIALCHQHSPPLVRIRWRFDRKIPHKRRAYRLGAYYGMCLQTLGWHTKTGHIRYFISTSWLLFKRDNDYVASVSIDQLNSREHSLGKMVCRVCSSNTV